MPRSRVHVLDTSLIRLTRPRVSGFELIRSAVEMPCEMRQQDTCFRELSYGNHAHLYMQGAREIVSATLYVVAGRRPMARPAV